MQALASRWKRWQEARSFPRLSATRKASPSSLRIVRALRYLAKQRHAAHSGGDWWARRDSNPHAPKRPDLQSGEPASCSTNPWSGPLRLYFAPGNPGGWHRIHPLMWLEDRDQLCRNPPRLTLRPWLPCCSRGSEAYLRTAVRHPKAR